MKRQEKKLSIIFITIILIFFICLFNLSSYAATCDLPGDFVGPMGDPTPDGKVDFNDLMVFATAYGSVTGDPNWNALCDICGYLGDPTPDGKVNFDDLMVFATNYGKVMVPILNDPGISVSSSTSYTVSWTPVSGATSYVLQEDKYSNFNKPQEYILTGTSRKFSHISTSTTTYYYRVAAVDSCGQSGWSNVEDIIINCTLPSAPTLSDPGTTLPAPANYTVSWFLLSGATSCSSRSYFF